MEEQEKRKEEEKEKEATADGLKSVTNRDYNIDDFVPMHPAPTAVGSIFFSFAECLECFLN